MLSANGKRKTNIDDFLHLNRSIYKYMLSLLFSFISAYGILSADAGIVDSQIMNCIEHNHCISFRKPAQYLRFSNGGSDFHRHRLNSFVGMSRISLQRKEKAMR